MSLGERKRINIEGVKLAIEVIREFNALNLNMVDLCEDGKLIPITQAQLKEWDFVGMGNKTFVECRFWEETVEEDGPFVNAPDACHCHKCIEARGERAPGDRLFPLSSSRMIVCSKCGNKRCPHANDHRNECTNSNATGQPGSAY